MTDSSRKEEVTANTFPLVGEKSVESKSIGISDVEL